jgi:hypothetical protein
MSTDDRAMCLALYQHIRDPVVLEESAYSGAIRAAVPT